ncbi:glucosaminidase domain-containing protein [Raineyella sp.]|uniref:glucosaminidase domain-containing protein n=1 Tax=Raineyella sp. TaxID=1911550 RepID=UPI002B20E604|nr:glucosaminidase domain-containing protein [Raineyella sp.]MEA5154255.1 glucosaminidase domain-containing protein [Raineyella sp.]
MFGGAIFSPYARAVAPSTYIKQTVDAAQGVQREFKVPASVAIAQSILESGWGDSSLAKTYHNYFGIKCTSQKSPFQQGCVSLQTKEYSASGTSSTIVDGFRTYATTADSFADYGRLLSSLSRYRAAFDHTDDPDRFIRDIAAGGYATDPQYADSVIRIMKQYDLYQYDKLPAAAPTADAVADRTTDPTPAAEPSEAPTVKPSDAPSTAPSAKPSDTVTIKPSVTATASPSATATASAPGAVTTTPAPATSAQPSVPVTSAKPSAPAPSASAGPSAPASSTSTDKPAGVTGVIWVINPQTGRVYFSGTVTDANGKPLANTAFQVVDTTGASLGTVTTDAQGHLNAGLDLPSGWSKVPNYEVLIRFPGSGDTRYTEGSTTIPAGATTPASGTLTGGDPNVASAKDTGLDRDDKLPGAGASASATATASSATPTPSASSATPTTTPVWPAGLATSGSPSASAAPVVGAPRSAAPSAPAAARTAGEHTGHPGNAVDNAATALAARLPRTGGPAAIIGLLGLGILAAGATLITTSRVRAPGRED